MKLKAFRKLLVALLAAASLQAAIAPTAHVAALDPAPPQMDFFGLVDENAERIVRQNKRRICWRAKTKTFQLSET